MEGQRILVATDLSDNARPAARVGAEFGNAFGMDVEVMHVFDATGYDGDKKYKMFRSEELREKVERRVVDWYEESADTTPDTVTLEVGGPDSELRARAQQDDIACLVLAMSGRGAWNRLIFGSTALTLSGRPPCTLAIAHPEYHRVQREMTIGMGTDFSETSDGALLEASWLARTFDSSLRICHAHALPSSTIIRQGELPPGVERTEVVEWARNSMEKYTERHREVLEGLDWKSKTIAEPPVAGLRTFVENQGIDWLVLGHRRPDQRQGAAPVKGKWVQRMTCSTLIVPTTPRG